MVPQNVVPSEHGTTFARNASLGYHTGFELVSSGPRARMDHRRRMCPASVHHGEPGAAARVARPASGSPAPDPSMYAVLRPMLNGHTAPPRSTASHAEYHFGQA